MIRLQFSREGKRVEARLPDSGGRARIGRASDCEIAIDDPKASKVHAVVSVESSPDGPKVFAEDGGSRNGTFVNGRKIDGRTLLGSGDRIRVGATEFVLFAGAPAAAAGAGASAAAMWLLLALFFAGATFASKIAFGALIGRLMGT